MVTAVPGTVATGGEPDEGDIEVIVPVVAA
jgi:hypothetical protein